MNPHLGQKQTYNPMRLGSEIMLSINFPIEAPTIPPIGPPKKVPAIPPIIVDVLPIPSLITTVGS